MQRLCIGYLSTLYHTSHLVRAQGLIETHLPCEPVWRLFGTGPAMVDAFAAGELDLGFIGLPPAMIGISHGLPLRCIAGGHVQGTVMVGYPGMVSVQHGADISNLLAGLAGKKIGAPRRGSIHDVIVRWLVQTHRTGSVEIVNYPWAELIPEAITAGEIAAGVGTPQLAVLAQRFYHCAIVLGPELLWPFNPSYGIVAHEKILGQRALIEQFLILHEQACELMRCRPDEAAPLVARQSKVVDATFVRDVFSISPHYCASLPRRYIQATMDFVPVLQDMGYIQNSLTEDMVFDTTFINSVHPCPHHYTASLKDAC